MSGIHINRSQFMNFLFIFYELLCKLSPILTNLRTQVNRTLDSHIIKFRIASVKRAVDSVRIIILAVSFVLISLSRIKNVAKHGKYKISKVLPLLTGESLRGILLAYANKLRKRLCPGLLSAGT